MPKIVSCYVTLTQKPTWEEENSIDTMLASLGFTPTTSEWIMDDEEMDYPIWQQEYVRRTT